MLKRDACTSLGHLLNPKLRYVGNDNSLLTLNTLQDIYALLTHNNALSRERQVDKFLTHLVPGFHVGDKVLVRNHTRDVWNPKYGVSFHAL